MSADAKSTPVAMQNKVCEYGVSSKPSGKHKVTQFLFIL